MSNNNTVYDIYHKSCNFYDVYYHKFDFHVYIVHNIMKLNNTKKDDPKKNDFMKVETRPVIAFCKIDQNFYGYPQSGDTTD